jgi:hydroxymethylpyrimidine/phosphomethylpyrimidine kinase
MKQYRRTLTIAGSDSGGGAGIQADLKTFSALGCYGMSVLTALTAQNTTAVTAIHAVPPEFIAAQLDAVLSDLGVDAVKVGMLHSPEVIQVVAEKLREFSVTQLVVDPVMIAKSGDRLLQAEAVAALRSELLPLAQVVTPNLPEAAVLLGVDVLPPMRATAAQLLSVTRAQAVLLKGGHDAGDVSTDWLFPAEGVPQSYAAARVVTQNDHGTGCTLSAAIAARLAQGDTLPAAVAHAKDFLTKALTTGAQYQLGRGHGPVHHFHAFW